MLKSLVRFGHFLFEKQQSRYKLKQIFLCLGIEAPKENLFKLALEQLRQLVKQDEALKLTTLVNLIGGNTPEGEFEMPEGNVIYNIEYEIRKLCTDSRINLCFANEDYDVELEKGIAHFILRFDISTKLRDFNNLKIKATEIVAKYLLKFRIIIDVERPDAL